MKLQTKEKSLSTQNSLPTKSMNLRPKCSNCDIFSQNDELKYDLKKQLSMQRRSTVSTGQVAIPPVVHELLNSPGKPLDPDTRAFMEPSFGHDFSKVRVHADSKAAESARAVNALAYTVGQNVVLGEEKYAPSKNNGRKLLAHE